MSIDWGDLIGQWHSDNVGSLLLIVEILCLQIAYVFKLVKIELWGGFSSVLDPDSNSA